MENLYHIIYNDKRVLIVTKNYTGNVYTAEKLLVVSNLETMIDFFEMKGIECKILKSILDDPSLIISGIVMNTNDEFSNELNEELS